MSEYENWGRAYWDAANKGYDLQQKVNQNAELTDRERAIAETLARYKARLDEARRLQDTQPYQAGADPNAPVAPSAVPTTNPSQYAVPQQGYPQQIPQGAINRYAGQQMPQGQAQGQMQIPPQVQQAIRMRQQQPAQAGQSPYTYDFNTRQRMTNQAIEDRDAALQQAFARTRASDKVGAFIRDLNLTEKDQSSAKDNKFVDQVKDAFVGDEWLNIPGIEGIIQSSTETFQAYTPLNMGHFQVKDGKNGQKILLNNTGKGWRTIPASAVARIKRMAMAEIIGLRTGNWGLAKDSLDSIDKENAMWNKNRSQDETERSNRANEAIKLRGQDIDKEKVDVERERNRVIANQHALAEVIRKFNAGFEQHRSTAKMSNNGMVTDYTKDYKGNKVETEIAKWHQDSGTFISPAAESPEQEKDAIRELRGRGIEVKENVEVAPGIKKAVAVDPETGELLPDLVAYNNWFRLSNAIGIPNEFGKKNKE